MIWGVVSLKLHSCRARLVAGILLAFSLMESVMPASEMPRRSLDPSTAELRGSITPIPLHLALHPQRVALGERLFNDVRLLHDNTRSCATCHPLERGGMDGQPRACVPADRAGVRTAVCAVS